LLHYRATLPGLTDDHLSYLTRLLTAHQASIRCRWRRIDPAGQALLVLAHLRCGDTFAQLAASFDVSVVTAYRYVTEAVRILAEQAPTLDQALADRAGQQVTVGDGTIIPTFRVRLTPEHKRWWVHRKKTYGINLQAIADQTGNLLWISTGLPGAVHDLTAARTHDVFATAGRYQLVLWPTAATRAPAQE
jgi:hypothetical protein